MPFIPKGKEDPESGREIPCNLFIFNNLAERVGFEPTLEFPLNTLSKRAPSATRPSLRRDEKRCSDSSSYGRPPTADPSLRSG